MDHCLIQDEQHQEVMNHVKQWLNELNISIYDEQSKNRINQTSRCENWAPY